MGAIAEDPREAVHPSTPLTPSSPAAGETCITCKEPAGPRGALLMLCTCHGHKMHPSCWSQKKKCTTLWDQTTFPVCDSKLRKLQEFNRLTHFGPDWPYPTGDKDSKGSHNYPAACPTFGGPWTAPGRSIYPPGARNVMTSDYGMAVTISARGPSTMNNGAAAPISMRGNCDGTPEPVEAGPRETRGVASPDTPATLPSPGPGDAGARQGLRFSPTGKGTFFKDWTTCFRCKAPGEKDNVLVAHCDCAMNLMHEGCWEKKTSQ